MDNKDPITDTGRMEILIFMLQDINNVPDAPLFGINVFKVRELMVAPRLFQGPNKRVGFAGTANIRGVAVPTTDLNQYFGYTNHCQSNILVVTEFNGSTHGFLVHEVHNIMQLKGADIKKPPDAVSELVGQKNGSVLTAISTLEDGRTLMMIDVEQVISEVFGCDRGIVESYELTKDYAGKNVFFADDSKVARRQIRTILDKMEIQHNSAKDGEEAWTQLQSLASHAEQSGDVLADSLDAIITDVEMPLMNGYQLTEKIKADPRFNNIPVLMHSSLSASESSRLGVKVGADAYIPKLRPKEFSEILGNLLMKRADALST